MTVKNYLCDMIGAESDSRIPQEALKRLIVLEDVALGALSTITLKNATTRKDFLARRGPDAQSLLNLLQAVCSPFLKLLSSACDRVSAHQIVDYPMVESESVRRLHTGGLIALSKASGLYPECMALKNVQMIGKDPIARGGYGDVWRGMFQGKPIAMKVLRCYETSALVELLRVVFALFALYTEANAMNK
jgi:hypothetical protein